MSEYALSLPREHRDLKSTGEAISHIFCKKHETISNSALNRSFVWEKHGLTCTCPHVGWVPPQGCCRCDHERTNPGNHPAHWRPEGARTLCSHRAFAQSWEEKILVLGLKTLFYLTLMLRKPCERPLVFENAQSLFVPCNGTHRWQIFMESRVRRLLLMLSWEKTFPSACEQQGTPPQHPWGFSTSRPRQLRGLSHPSHNCLSVHTRSKRRKPCHHWV